MSTLLEMRELALDGLRLLLEEAESKYTKHKNALAEEVELFESDPERSGELLSKLLVESESVWKEYVEAMDDLTDGLQHPHIK